MFPCVEGLSRSERIPYSFSHILGSNFFGSNAPPAVDVLLTIGTVSLLFLEKDPVFVCYRNRIKDGIKMKDLPEGHFE